MDIPVVVLYYMNGCGHCEVLRPVWNSVLQRVHAMDGITIAEVERDEMQTLPTALKNSIMGFPTICAVKKGKTLEEYHGDRSGASIMAFCKKFAHAPAKPKPKAKAPVKPKAKVPVKPKAKHT